MRPDDSALRFDIVPWFHGRVLDISEGSSKAFPHFISHIDCGITDADKLGLFSDGGLDGVLSSFLLDKLTESERVSALREWARVVRDGGHIVLHVQDAMTYDAVVGIMDRIDRSWDLVHFESRERNELLFSFQLQ